MHQIDNGIKENFFRWDGRLNRKRYLKRLLALAGISALYILFLIAAVVFGIDLPDPDTANGFFGVFTLLSLPITIASYMLMIRRLHDTGLSGFLILLNFVPLVNLGLLLYVLFKKGTEGDNQYGPDPLSGIAGASETYENPYARATCADTPTDIAPPRNPQG